MSSYEVPMQISQFKGLMQYGDGINTDIQYATEENNAETKAGVLQPVAACTLLPATLPSPIETLMHLYRRWHTDEAGRDVLIAASAGALYWMYPTGNEWTQITMPENVEAFASDIWSWVAYEINPVGSTASVDVLLISNAVDGMYMIIPPSEVTQSDWAIEAVGTPKKFGVIERYAERIWGGAITEDPDQLVYSAPYDPTDWDANPETPEDGAGDINQPSWDGDSFTALKSFGSQLIAFKRTRIWRILGTDPGEYTFKEQYGGGAPYEKTIAVDSERIFMLGPQGIMVYDGLSANPFQQQYAADIWKRMNKTALSEATAILWQDKYYCAFPLDNSEINNAVIIYNTVDGTWLLRTDVCVESFLGTEKDLYFTSSTTPGRIWKWVEDSWENGPTSAPVSWVSPWTDMGAKNVVKGGFEIYFLAEAKDPVTLSFSIETEKKVKTKKYQVQPSNKKQKRIHFGGSGRRFRIIIQAPANAGSWRLVSGMLIIAETDPD